MSGRPTKLQQEKIRNTIIESYISGLSPTQIIQKTRFNKDTVYQHLKKFQKERKSDPFYNKTLSYIVDRAILAFDHRLEKTLQFESEIEKIIKNSRVPSRYLFSLRAKLSQHIVDLLDKKFSFEIQVGADDLINPGEQ